MNLAMLLDVIDGLEEIKIKDYGTLKPIYEGKKYKIYKVKDIDFDAKVAVVYTVAGKINIEIE